MVQTEIVESNFVKDNNNMKIRTEDECLAIYKTQVKLFYITFRKKKQFILY